MRCRTRVGFAILGVSLASAASVWVGAQGPGVRPPDSVAAARSALAQLDGSMVVFGLHEPVEVLRDRWGIPHIYARNTHDLFFAQGFVVAQDRMWQLEMWRRNGEGRLAEVLGPDYVTRDRFARVLTFRGNWDEEFRKYHPEGRLIFDAFAKGVNASIQKALDENKVPVEFQIMDFRPQPVWTARTLLTRMPGWTLSRNAASEVQRALDIKAMGVAKVLELKPTDPEKRFTVPEGLDLDDIDAAILGIARDANNLRWSLPVRTAWGIGAGQGMPHRAAQALFDQAPGLGALITPNPWLANPDLGSNNWVIGGRKSATGMPLIANDPHREVVNPALRHVVHLNGPGWSAIGATEPGLPGISIGHNDRLAWGFTILGMDQQDIYVEQTDPDNPNRYLADGQWRDMRVERELVWVRGRDEPVTFDVKLTRHGPVLYENTTRHRAFALRWVGAEPGGAGYLGSLNVMQTRNWKEFNDALPKAWYIPSHSLVYADVEGNYGYIGVALTPVRKNWDGLLPVPGKDGAYEWEGFVPFEALPKALNGLKGFYNSSNNDVVPRIVPEYSIPLGYEYSAPFRYDRVHEVLAQDRKFTVADLERLQQDVVSLPARELVPLLKGIEIADPLARQARDRLLGWDYALARESVPAAIYEFWAMKLGPLAFAPRVPAAAKASVRQYDMRRIIAWMKKPDRAYGDNPRAGRDRILAQALEEAVIDLRKRLGDDLNTWKWGALHTADFVHPLAASDPTGTLFHVGPVSRGGDGFTVMAATSPTEASTTQTSGASFMFVFDVKDWDNSTGLSVPGNSAQPLSPHYKDLTPHWGEGKYFPLAFSRAKVEEVTAHRLVLHPIRPSLSPPAPGDAPIGPGARVDVETLFEPVQPELFTLQGGQPNAWADFDGDGDLDLFVGFRGQLSRLYRNDAGTFIDVAAAVGLADHNDVRVAAWGDHDDDGDPDLYVGYSRTSTVPNRLYRNDGGRFTDVGRQMGVDLVGTSRQASFIDFDNDGDTDLFVAFRDRPNALFRNDGGRYREVAAEIGMADPRKTVGAIWFDADGDGDLDLFVANQDGDLNGLFRNDRGRFIDVARELGLDGAGRPHVYGGVGPSVVDYDNDGDLDLFVANYGPNALYRNEGGGKFVEVGAEVGVAGDYHGVSSAWGDFDNDGRPDLYVTSSLTSVMHARDYLYRNGATSFSDVTPSVILKHDGSHGAQWMDFDYDGDVDLALADNGSMGVHFLFRNRLPAPGRRRGMNVMVLDQRGRYTRAGSEVRVYAAGTRKVIGSRLVDTGSGYCSQNMAPVHIGAAGEGLVDVEVTTFGPGGTKLTRVAGVDPVRLAGAPLVVRAGAAAPARTP
ncbi:MAG: penicillin acylase family protein [Acidobacteriota bacterium]